MRRCIGGGSRKHSPSASQRRDETAQFPAATTSSLPTNDMSALSGPLANQLAGNIIVQRPFSNHNEITEKRLVEIQIHQR